MSEMTEPASPWVMRFAPMIRPGGVVLDMACGRGRNARWLATHGWEVEAADLDPHALAGLQGIPGITALQVDLENSPWPFTSGEFDGIIVCRYLHRALLSHIPGSLKAQGVLIYETFMQGQEQYGRPRNPDFLLKHGELLNAFSPVMEVLAYEEGLITEPTPAILQRICAKRVIK
jgi:SAM-dependent methyltransferase